jgi:hypothetical protein
VAFQTRFGRPFYKYSKTSPFKQEVQRSAMPNSVPYSSGIYSLGNRNPLYVHQVWVGTYLLVLEAGVTGILINNREPFFRPCERAKARRQTLFFIRRYQRRKHRIGDQSQSDRTPRLGAYTTLRYTALYFHLTVYFYCLQ